MNKVKIIECPRDAMQGIKSHFISTDAKARYINSLLKVGFDTIDFGSCNSTDARYCSCIIKIRHLSNTK